MPTEEERVRDPGYIELSDLVRAGQSDMIRQWRAETQVPPAINLANRYRQDALNAFNSAFDNWKKEKPEHVVSRMRTALAVARQDFYHNILNDPGNPRRRSNDNRFDWPDDIGAFRTMIYDLQKQLANASKKKSRFGKIIKIGLVAALGLFGYKAAKDGVPAAVDSATNVTKNVGGAVVNIVKNTGSGLLNTLRNGVSPRRLTQEEEALQQAEYETKLAKLNARTQQYKRQGQAQVLGQIVDATNAAYQGSAYVRGIAGNVKTTERIIQGKKGYKR